MTSNTVFVLSAPDTVVSVQEWLYTVCGGLHGGGENSFHITGVWKDKVSSRVMLHVCLLCYSCFMVVLVGLFWHHSGSFLVIAHFFAIDHRTEDMSGDMSHWLLTWQFIFIAKMFEKWHFSWFLYIINNALLLDQCLEHIITVVAVID